MDKMKQQQKPKLVIERDYSKYGFREDVEYVYKTKKGLTEETVREISKQKNEPKWMLDFRLKALEYFFSRPMPTWGADLSKINFDEMVYYLKPTEKKVTSWEELPEAIRRTFDKLGIPEAERKFLAGVGAQFDSENVLHKVREDLAKQGVIFSDVETAMQEYPDIVKKYFGTVIPPNDNKFAALNSAVWSGGSFVYVPEGVAVKLPLQAYFRINSPQMGQFERTLIIAEPGSKVHYIEGCTAAIYSADSLHAAVVEVIALPGAHVRYTTLQNWSNDVYNLVTKRAHAYENSIVEWLDANIGSRVTMKYPSVYLLGENARADILSIAFAGNGQWQDTGAKAIHLAPNTTSTITAKSVSKDGGKTTYRGLVRIMPGAVNSKSFVRCVKPDTLILGDNKPINEYAAGNHAVGLSGINKVTQIFVNDFKGEMIKIKPVGMFPIEVTPEHPILTSVSKIVYPYIIRNGKHAHTTRIKVGSLYWEEASKLTEKKSNRPGNYVIVPRIKGHINISSLNLSPFTKGKGSLKRMLKKINSTVFPLTEETSWLLGLYVAEGCASQGHIKFGLNTTERDLQKKAIEIYKKLGYKASIYKRKDENCIEITISDAPLSRAFENWCGKYAPNKRIPEFILFHKNQKLLESFLNGYIAEDGYIATNCIGVKNIIRIITTSKILAMQVQLLGARLNLFFKIRKATPSPQIQGRRVNIHDKYDLECSLSNKIQAKFEENYMFVPISKIEKTFYKGPVYNLETANHNYLVSNAVTHNCDALILDEQSVSDTVPYMEINENKVSVGHEATVGKVNDAQLFYLMSRGLTEQQALTLIVNGFFEAFTKELPLEYAVEFNRLIQLEMTGAVG